jgi:hypothetical protein
MRSTRSLDGCFHSAHRGEAFVIFMAVIVSSKVTKHGNKISGDILDSR